MAKKNTRNTRASIVDAAWQLFYEQGYEDTTVEEIAEKFVKVTGTVEPDPELVAKYEDRYQKFRQIYPACRPLFEIIK